MILGEKASGEWLMKKKESFPCCVRSKFDRKFQVVFHKFVWSTHKRRGRRYGMS